MKIDVNLTNESRNINKESQETETLARKILCNDSNSKYNHCYYINQDEEKYLIDFYKDTSKLNKVIKELKTTLKNASTEIEVLKGETNENIKYMLCLNNQVLFGVIFY